MVTLDVKPWDDETNMDELIANVRAIEKGQSLSPFPALCNTTCLTVGGG